ncbi:hypothetical protein RPE78_04865 [Thioclava litoralis]|uniref:SET and RING associated domain-containing protein n=1 Tax=Thioclava litoralis TaxID=3076557 RepID=A0ABZ1E2P2_9RHOB|nr:hypothetical protein RPE78_04865 [Thioclava sp. FTW29]
MQSFTKDEALNKSEYVRRSLTKISHKTWEYFIISRIIHRLDDFSIEFVTQQLVKRPDGSRALTDLFYPQLGLHLEINEPFHKENIEADSIRQRDIVNVTKHRIENIDIDETSTIEEMCARTDAFIEIVKSAKAKLVDAGNFRTWDLESRYLADPIIQRGYIDVDDNVTFRLQAEAMKCFGFDGKGWQKAAWKFKDSTNDSIWFPRLYPHDPRWTNELSADGKVITQKANNEDGIATNRKILSEPVLSPKGNVVVFAKAKDALGENLLRYVGTFVRNRKLSNEQCITYELVRTREQVRV